MVVPPALVDSGVTSPPAAGGPRTTRFRAVLLAVLVVLALVAAGLLAWLLLARGDDGDDVQSSREEVMSQTEQFMLRMGTYGPDLLDEHGAMPEYRSRVTDVITDKFAASFDSEAGTAEQLVAQAGVTRVADVFSTGVSSIDQDSARALVAVDGEWLVDDFDPVSGDGAAPTQPDPGAQP